MGRGKLPLSEYAASALERLARRVAEAVVAGNLDEARALIDAANTSRAVHGAGSA
jgi:hypothetical protein